MANTVVQYAYVSGEISPTLYSRSDLEKYDLGLALARNWLVDYRGGISTRPGTQFTDWLEFPESVIRWFPFEFSTNVANTNTVVFGNGYIRFLQEGTYVLAPTKTVEAIVGDKVMITAHGYSAGLGKFLDGPLAGRSLKVVPIDVDTFILFDFLGDPVIPVGTQFALVYTVVNPYASTDLIDLKVEQVRDVLRLTHYKYPTRDLRRITDNTWTLSLTQFSTQVASPTNLSGMASGAGAAGTSFCVTAVDANGSESLSSDILILNSIVNYTTTAGSVNLSWAPVPGAVRYNVYRSLVLNDGTQVNRGAQLGYLGSVYGATFTDSNIIPDFTRLPPLYNNPFANGSIEQIDVLGGGSSYDNTSTITITDPTGTGAEAIPLINAAGAVSGVLIRNKGSNYTAPAIVMGGAGSGATFDITTGSFDTNYPAVSAVFQQRQVYAGSIARPLGVWGSRPGRLDNFDLSPVQVDNDSYSFELDTNKVSMIRHLIPMRGGLLLLNDVGIWQLTGGNSVAITPSNAAAEPQSYTGVSSITPLKIETDLLYVEAKGYTVRLLSYNDLAKLYAGTDISILAAHFFGKNKEIVSWAFAQEPYKLVHAVRSDGVCLLGTILKEQNIFAWTSATTRGKYKQALTLREDNVDSVYFDIERVIKGKLVRFIERAASRDFARVEEAWAVDAGLQLAVNYPNTTATVSAVIGPAIVSATAPLFSSSDVGKIIYGGGGKMRLTGFISANQMNCEIVQRITELYFETDIPAVWQPGTWSLDTPVTSVSGLWFLEGETVSLLADGSVMAPRKVVNGTVTLDAPATRVIVGLGYECRARTLPVTANGNTVEGKRKRIVGVASRLHEGRGLKSGLRLDKLYEFKDRTTELYGEPIIPRSEMIYNTIEPQWDVNGQFYYVVTDPLPVTILGHVLETEVGDDPG